MIRISVIHGPHLEKLGKREHGYYGSLTLQQVNERIITHARNIGVQVETYQSGNESDIVQKVHTASETCDGIVINPAGFGYSSLILRDAVILSKVPVVEVHLSNIHARETFRQKTIIADVCLGQITGFKWIGYCAALDILKMVIEETH